MRKRNKNLIILSITTIILLIALGVTYAVYQMSITGSNQELIVGDIYMKYTETNQITLDNAMPFDISKANIVNPVMATQETRENELTKCVDLFTGMGAPFDEGLTADSTAESFCKGTGTFNGNTFQNLIDDMVSSEDGEQKLQILKSKNIITSDNKVNPAMATQTYQPDSRNELSKCMDYFELDFDIYATTGESLESYCKGTGTLNGTTLQESINSTSDGWVLGVLKNKNIITNDNVVNSDMDSQTYQEATNELSKCVNYIYAPFDLFSESLCKSEKINLSGEFGLQDLIDDGAFSEKQLTTLKNKNVLVSSMDSLPYFEFKITGKNTYTKKDIWYEIVLSHGDSHATRTTRIRDELLRFTLVEIKDGVETTVRENISYDDLSSKRIYVNTIEKNTTSEVDITYRLYMWIDYNTVIGNVDEDYTIDEWNDVYASIKVNVTGDFNEKEYNVTPESCFTTTTKTNYVVNDVMKTQTYTSGGTNELSQCVDYFSNLSFDAGSTAESYCKGTGTKYGRTFQLDIKNFALNVLTELENKNIIVDQGEVIRITDYDTSCGSDVVIPKTINDLKVDEIGGSAFSRKNLTSVIIPNTVKIIDGYAFYKNQLTSVEFEKNSTLLSIIDEAFSGENQQITEVFIPESVISLDCNAFNYDVIIHKSNDLICYSNPK